MDAYAKARLASKTDRLQKILTCFFKSIGLSVCAPLILRQTFPYDLPLVVTTHVSPNLVQAQLVTLSPDGRSATGLFPSNSAAPRAVSATRRLPITATRATSPSGRPSRAVNRVKTS